MFNLKFFLKSIFVKLNIIIIIIILSACSTNDSTIQDKTINASDPLEGMNRMIFSFNQGVDKAVLAPVAKGYRYILPKEVRKGVRNFLSNLSEPWTTINSTLQGDVSNAGTSLARFMINSTVGVLGIFDVASSVGFKKQKEDFGQTLAVSGVGPGPYIIIPLLGPSTSRDVLGKVVSLFADPVTYVLHREDHDSWIWIGTALRGLDFREQNLEKIDNLKASSVDFYATIRSLYLERRSRMIANQPTDDKDPFQDFELDVLREIQ